MSKGGAICVMCSKSKSERDVYKHRNNKITNGFGFCKECINTYTTNNDMDSVVDALRMMNIPFVNHVWENVVGNGEEATFGKYLQLIATQRRYKDFNDSEFDSEDGDFQVLDITDDIIARWGVKDTKEEYIELEQAYNTLTKIKEPATLFEEKRYAQNVKLGMAVDDALADNEIRALPQLRKAYSDDLKDLGLDVKQTSEDDARTLGVRIAEWERHDPVPSNKDLSDVDRMQEYIDKWFLIPMKRVFGRASEEEINRLYE